MKIGDDVMSKELYDIMERESLTLDCERLRRFKNKSIDNIIDEFRNEFIDRYDYDLGIISVIYKFTEELKEKIHF